MAKKKKTHLSILMKELGVTGTSLAEYLNVDESLVSKWKSDLRKIREDYMEKMIVLFLSLDEKNKFKKIISVTGTEVNNFTKEQLKNYLPVWLNLSPQENEESLEAFLPDTIQSVKAFIYFGEEGKNEAVKTFLDFTAKGKKQRVWLYSSQGTEWLMHDDDQKSEWQSKNFAVLENNEIHVLHPVYKDYRHIADYMLRWLPLHIYGNAFAYYIPKYQVSLFDYTLCLTEDRVALISITTAEKPKLVTTYLISDEQSLQCIKGVVAPFFRNSRPLFSNYSYVDGIKYHEAYQKFAKSPYRGMCFTAGPPLFLIRRELLRKCIVESVYSDVIEAVSFESSLEYGLSSVTVVFHLDHMTTLLQMEKPEFRTLSYLLGRPICLTQEQFRECILDILDLAKANPQIRIMLVEYSIFHPYGDIDMFIREREIAGIVGSYMHTDHISRALTIREEIVIAALFHTLEYFVDTHPNQMDDLERVREKLLRLFAKYPIK